jgi:hypothetical protein
MAGGVFCLPLKQGTRSVSALFQKRRRKNTLLILAIRHERFQPNAVILAINLLVLQFSQSLQALTSQLLVIRLAIGRPPFQSNA